MKDIEFVKAPPFFGFPQASEEPIDPNPNPNPNPTPSPDGSIQYLEIPYEHSQFLEIEKASPNYFIQTPCMKTTDSAVWNIAIKMPDDQQFPFNVYFEASNAYHIQDISFIFKINGQYEYYKVFGSDSRVNYTFYNSEYGITAVSNKLTQTAVSYIYNFFRIGDNCYFAGQTSSIKLNFINPFSDVSGVLNFGYSSKIFPQSVDLSTIVESDLLQFITANNLASPGVLSPDANSFKLENPEAILGKTLTNYRAGYVWKF